jgi:hypothetical protein
MNGMNLLRKKRKSRLFNVDIMKQYDLFEQKAFSKELQKEERQMEGTCMLHWFLLSKLLMTNLDPHDHHPATNNYWERERINLYISCSP